MHEVAEKIVYVLQIIFSRLQQNPQVRPSMKQVSEKLSPMVSSSSKSTNLVMNTIIIVEKIHYYILCNQKPPTFLLLEVFLLTKKFEENLIFENKPQNTQHKEKLTRE